MNHLTKLTILTIIGSLMGAGFYFGYSGNTVTEPALAQTEQTQATTSFTFVIDSFVEPKIGAINIYSDGGVALLQRIELPDPNMRLADRIHENFNVTDINFDGYADIGVLVDGGVKWSVYQYWLFDKNVNQFVETPFTQDFRKLNFNEIIFDATKKQIITNNFCGTLICDKDIYEVKNNRLILLEAHHQEQPYNENGIEEKCEITVTKYQGSTETTTTTNINTACPGYYQEK